MRADRAGRRILREAEALSECGLLYRVDLSIHGFSDYDVSGTVCDPADVGLDCAVGRNAVGPGAEDFAAAAGLFGRGSARVCTSGKPQVRLGASSAGFS